MWALKLKVNSKKQFLGSFAIKHEVSMSGYPLSYYKDDKSIYLVTWGFMFGKEEDKKALIKDIKKQPELVKFETNNDFAILIIKQPLFTEPIWNPMIIRPSPHIINHKERKHIWDLASFERKPLEDVITFAKKHLGAEILKFKREKISNISITKPFPKLTKRQKLALELAINNGYYDYPKKINLEKLAKIMKVYYSTYQQHLKTAEGAIMPEVYKEL